MIGRKIEDGVQLLLDISGEVADMQNFIEHAKEELAMFAALFDINKYMSANLDITKLIPLIEDVIIGMVGANYSAVILDDDAKKESKNFGLSLSYYVLSNEKVDTLYVEDLSVNPMYGVNSGCLYIHKMELADNSYGFIVAYWALPNSITDKKMQFLSILSTQTGLSIKSARLVEKFKLLAIHDPLTGIYNRSYFNNIESTTIPCAGECMVMFDIDNFKLVNDTKGHGFGDTVLKTFANILKSTCDEVGAICFKYGGEEFTLKCNGGEAEGFRLANIVRERFLAETGFTVSAGVSGVGESCKLACYSSVIALADAAMYVSKQSGKNRVTVSNSDLQLFSKAGDDLCALLSQTYRSSTLASIVRLDIKSGCVMSAKDMAEFKTQLKGLLRRSDKVHITESMAALLIVDSLQLSAEDLVTRIKAFMTNNYPMFEYSVNICNGIFKEVTIHSSRVAEMVQTFGIPLGLAEEDLKLMRLACEWHDVGKLCISPEIYSKPGRLTDYEFSRIKHHAWLGYSLAKQDQTLRNCADWILKHHEDYNGKGYYGFKGNAIPLQAQIISIVDKFDALTEDRCYRKAYTWKEAVEILRSEMDKFNPELFLKFEKALETIYFEDAL